MSSTDKAQAAAGSATSADGYSTNMQAKDAAFDNLHHITTFTEGQVLQKPQKPFTMLSAASLGYAISNTPIAIFLTVGNAMFGGGPLFFYGTILLSVVSFGVAISLGELASAYPHAAGQYFWVAQIAPPSCRRFAAYMTAIVSWASVVCIGASCCSGNVTLIYQMVLLRFPDFEYKQWHGFMVYEGVNILAFSFNLYERFIPALGRGFLWFSLLTTAAFFAVLLASGSPKASGREFFAEYYNVSGWANGVAFFIGVSGVNWGFSCLDALTHLSEEIPSPRKNVPKALLVTVGIGVVSCFAAVFAVYFAAYDLTISPNVVQLLYQIYRGNDVPALVLGTMLLTSAWFSLIGIHTWQARIAWALGRDKGLPFHAHIGKLAPAPYDTPFWAHVWSTIWIGLCGFLFLGSSTAFNSFIAAGIILQYLTYSFPVVFLLLKGRRNFQHGPFWLPKLGLAANITLLSWTLITLVFYCFPYYLPVVTSQMNYLSVVLVVVFLYALGYWVLYGYKHFTLIDTTVILAD